MAGLAPAIHHAEHCALAGIPCALHLTIRGGIPACAHPAMTWPVQPGHEMPAACPCIAERGAPLPIPDKPVKAPAAARRSRAWRERWS